MKEAHDACCIITKNRWYFETYKRLEALSKKKLNELVQSRGKIDSPSNSSMQMSIAGAASFNVQVVVPLNKRVKLEASVA